MLTACVLLSPIGVRKTCVQCLERLVGEWCGADGSEALPGFREFAMKQVRLASPARPTPTPIPSPQASRPSTPPAQQADCAGRAAGMRVRRKACADAHGRALCRSSVRLQA